MVHYLPSSQIEVVPVTGCLFMLYNIGSILSWMSIKTFVLEYFLLDIFRRFKGGWSFIWKQIPYVNVNSVTEWYAVPLRGIDAVYAVTSFHQGYMAAVAVVSICNIPKCNRWSKGNYTSDKGRGIYRQRCGTCWSFRNIFYIFSLNYVGFFLTIKYIKHICCGGVIALFNKRMWDISK